MLRRRERAASAHATTKSYGEDAMGFLAKDEIDRLIPAEMLPHTTPVPTQIVSRAA
jgi:hypothetical protein